MEFSNKYNRSTVETRPEEIMVFYNASTGDFACGQCAFEQTMEDLQVRGDTSCCSGCAVQWSHIGYRGTLNQLAEPQRTLPAGMPELPFVDILVQGAPETIKLSNDWKNAF